MQRVKQLIWTILNSLGLGGPIQLVLNGALVEDGWYKSFNTKQSIDKQGNPLPWCTYAFIKFIEPRLKKHFDAFEFGCGNSTLWYAKRINTIKAVEHNKNWFTQMQKKIPNNATLVSQNLSPDGEYAREVLKEKKLYHLIIIDGEDRNNCLQNSLANLTEDGVIIYDNSNRHEYYQSFEMLALNGFKRIDLYGLAPIINYNSCTSIFYKEKNCLAI